MGINLPSYARSLHVKLVIHAFYRSENKKTHSVNQAINQFDAPVPSHTRHKNATFATIRYSWNSCHIAMVSACQQWSKSKVKHMTHTSL